MKAIHGTIHGKTIQLTDDPGLPPGVEVEVVVRPAPKAKKSLDGLIRSAGAWADVPGADEAIAEMERIRAEASYRDEEL